MYTKYTSSNDGVMLIAVCKKIKNNFDRGIHSSWWRHQMETSSALLAICAWNSPVPGEFPAQRPVTRSFDVFFDLRLNKRLSKQSWGWWFETLFLPLWRHRNVNKIRDPGNYTVPGGEHIVTLLTLQLDFIIRGYVHGVWKRDAARPNCPDTSSYT